MHTLRGGVFSEGELASSLDASLLGQGVHGALRYARALVEVVSVAHAGLEIAAAEPGSNAAAIGIAC